MKNVRVLLVDDNDKTRSSFAKLLKKTKGVTLVGECEDGDEVVDFINQSRVDVIFMDILMKKMDAFQSIVLVKDQFPYIKVINFSLSEDTELAKKCLDMVLMDLFLSLIQMKQ